MTLAFREELPRSTARVIELLGERPRLLAMVRSMLNAREALRQQCAVLHKMLLEQRAAEHGVPAPSFGAGRRSRGQIDVRDRHRRSGTVRPLPKPRSAFRSDHSGSITKAGRRRCARRAGAGRTDPADPRAALERAEGLGHGHRQAAPGCAERLWPSPASSPSSCIEYGLTARLSPGHERPLITSTVQNRPAHDRRHLARHR